MTNHHEKIEKSAGWLGILTVVAISFGTLVEITPLMFLKETTEPVDGLKPYTALQMEGRDVFIREGLYKLSQPNDSVHSVMKLNGMVIIQLLAKAFGNIHFYGVQNVQVLI